DLAYGLSSWLAIETRLRLGVVAIEATFTELDGSERTGPETGSIHHRTEVLVGPRDPWLMMRVGGKVGRFLSQARIGLTLPAGHTEPNPYALGRQGEVHQHVQFGSGTFRPLIGASLRHGWDPVSVSLGAVSVLSLYENSHGFRAPTRLGSNVTVELSLLDGRLVPEAKFVFAYEGAGLWDGRNGNEPEFARSVMLAGLGATYRFSDAWRASASVLARIAEVSDSASFDTPGQLSLTLARSFDFEARADD
ncbi:MAG: hypothetical protein VB934_14570, partial [Polyangiaceae bacterium]